jgi:hypothetical protein
MAAIGIATTLRLNGFQLKPSTESFTAQTDEMLAGGKLFALRWAGRHRVETR